MNKIDAAVHAVRIAALEAADEIVWLMFGKSHPRLWLKRRAAQLISQDRAQGDKSHG